MANEEENTSSAPSPGKCPACKFVGKCNVDCISAQFLPQNDSTISSRMLRQSQQPRQMATDKGKKVASDEDRGKLVIGNRPELLPDNSQSMIGESSEHIPPRLKRAWKMAIDNGKQVASTAHKGKPVIGNRPELLPNNSQAMIDEFSEQIPQRLKQARQMADYKRKQIASDAHEGKLVIGNRPQLLLDNTQPMIGNRPKLLPAQLQWRQIAPIPSSSRGQLIITDPPTHEYLTDQHHMAQVSSADTNQMLFRQPQQMAQTSSANTSQRLIRESQLHEYQRIVDQEEMGQISWADMLQLLSKDPWQHEFTRNVDQHQLGRMSSVDTGQNQLPYFPSDNQDRELSLPMAPRGHHNQQLQLPSDILSSDPRLRSQMKPQAQQHQQRVNSVTSQDSELSLPMAPRGHRNQQLQLPSDILSSDPRLRSQMKPQTQQHQQRVNSVTSQKPSFPPAYQNSELSLPMARQGQQNQPLRLPSYILSSDPCLRSQMMPQTQQQQQSHSFHEQYSQPVLDHRPIRYRPMIQNGSLQQTQHRAKDKGKQVALAAHKSKLVASLQGSRQSQQPRKIAKDKGKKVASAADRGKLVIGNHRPELLPDNSQSMIGESAGEHSPPLPNRPQKMTKDKGKQVGKELYPTQLG